MIVCSCNVFSDTDVKGCLRSDGGAPSGPGRNISVRDVYTRLGCVPQCGGCAPVIAKLLQASQSNDCQDMARLLNDNERPSDFALGSYHEG